MTNLFLDWKKNEPYFKMLVLMGRLSNLFSESTTPFIHYRVTENLFCKYFNFENLSRSDVAYDAKFDGIGVGIKTFTLKSNGSIEKIAEFNNLSHLLKELKGDELANQLAVYRNERMNVANIMYNITQPIYHIIGRKKHAIQIFNSDYDFVDINHLLVKSDNDKTLKFTDGKHDYTFNKSKSVLMKKFEVPSDSVEYPVEILADPYTILEELISNSKHLDSMTDSRLHVLLPLFAVKQGVKYIPSKSGLNQWNASGRTRHKDEVYINIPSAVHKENPTFFPDRNTTFTLRLPDGTNLSAKVCQEGNKALMSNPNKDLGNWILRKVLRIPDYELVTIEKLEEVGFDSLIIYKNSEDDFSIDVCYTDSYCNKI